MVTLPNICNLHRDIIFSNLFFVAAPKNPRYFLGLLSSSSMASSKVVAEYAKSGRSSCKKCSKTIAASALRLGLVTRDARGFDMTKWHHLSCFPINSESIDSPESIEGFSSLKSSDQESLKQLLDGSACSAEKVDVGDEDAVEGSKKRVSKSSRVHRTDEGENDELDDRNLKKTKLSEPTEGDKLDISFSTSDTKDKYKDATLLPKWKAFQTVIFLERDDGLCDSGKIAAFDFDGCLVKTSVKRVGPDAWSLMYSSIPEKLQSLYNAGYKLVIFTNEANIDRWKNKRQVAVDSKIGRVNNFIKHVKVPIQVFIACGIGKSDAQGEDPFRKPKTGMWHLMKQHFNSGISIDMDQSFYVGDAAGRPDDHSDADIKFAQANAKAIQEIQKNQGKKFQENPQESLNIVRNQTTDIIQETWKLSIRKKVSNSEEQNQASNGGAACPQTLVPSHTQLQRRTDLEIPLKVSDDVAMAIAAKGKLIHEWKTPSSTLSKKKRKEKLQLFSGDIILIKDKKIKDAIRIDIADDVFVIFDPGGTHQENLGKEWWRGRRNLLDQRRRRIMKSEGKKKKKKISSASLSFLEGLQRVKAKSENEKGKKAQKKMKRSGEIK